MNPQRITMYRNDDGQIVEENMEIIPNQIFPGRPVFLNHDVVMVPTQQGRFPLQVRVPCVGAYDVHTAFASIGNETYQDRLRQAAQEEIKRREAMARKQSLAGA
jgi:hypothetical protein